MMSGNVAQMNIDIDTLSEHDLIDLNRRIIERLRILQQMRAHKRMMAFSIGERVKFRASRGKPNSRVTSRHLTTINSKFLQSDYRRCACNGQYVWGRDGQDNPE